MVVGMTVVLGIWGLICMYPLVVIGIPVVYGGLLYWVNSIYRKNTGKDMKAYTLLKNM